jgi:ABC-2 type transport system permease protein
MSVPTGTSQAVAALDRPAEASGPQVRATIGTATRALRAEWTKLRTTPGPAWLLAGAVVLTAGVSAAVVAASRCPAGTTCQVDMAKTSLTGVLVGQAVVAILAVLIVSNEYSSQLIKITLAAIPRRIAVLGAKALLVGSLVLLAGAVAVGACILDGRAILSAHGFTAARGIPALSLSNGPVLRAACGSVLYLVLIALLSVGIAVLVRDSAVSIGAVLALLYVFPIVTSFVQNPTWQHRLQRYSPMAGLNIQATTNLHGLPITPWGGLGVLALWALAALLAGGLVFRLRDA